MRREFDIDIDVKPSTDKKAYGIQAMVYNENQKKVLPHPAGFYLEPVPVDDVTGNCAFDYKYGSECGFMKVDILSNTVYEGFRDKEEVLRCLESEFDWGVFDDERIVSGLPHIAKHFDIVSQVKPQCIDDLADILALIRPGKRDKLTSYLRNKEKVRKTLYRRANDDLNYFKKSHAYSYAMMIMVYVQKTTNPSGIRW